MDSIRLTLNLLREFTISLDRVSCVSFDRDICRCEQRLIGLQLNRFSMYCCRVAFVSVSATASVIVLVLDSSGNGSQGFQCLTSSPCKNGGSCLPSMGEAGSYSCVCLFGTRGSDCGVSARGFQPLAYMQFTVALDRSQNAIVLEIATNRNRSLLLYYVADDQGFVAIEIIQGQVRFSFGGGQEGGTVFRVTNPQLVSDGQWYRVEATREIMVSMQGTNGRFVQFKSFCIF